jgi:hypothetical protein
VGYFFFQAGYMFFPYQVGGAKHNAVVVHAEVKEVAVTAKINPIFSVSDSILETLCDQKAGAVRYFPELAGVFKIRLA